MNGFVRGELVIMQRATYFSEWNGAIGVVVGLLQERNAKDMNTMETLPLVAYKVLPLVEGAIEVVSEPHQIRKLRKPRGAREETRTQWIECEDPALTD